MVLEINRRPIKMYPVHSHSRWIMLYFQLFDFHNQKKKNQINTQYLSLKHPDKRIHK